MAGRALASNRCDRLTPDGIERICRRCGNVYPLRTYALSQNNVGGRSRTWPSCIGQATRDQYRSRRKREVRAASQSLQEIKLELELDRSLYSVPEWRPKTRDDCAQVPRPCPYVGCRYNLFLDVSRAGSIKLNFPDLEPGEMSASCALDLAERGPIRLEQVGEHMNITRERVRQIENLAMRSLKRVHLRILRELNR